MSPISKAFALALVVAPPALAAEELLRSGVLAGADSTLDQLRAVHENAGAWQAHILVGMIAVLALTAALLGLTAALAPRAPRWAFAGGVLALVAGLGSGLHLGFYSIQTGIFAADPAQFSAAEQILANGDQDTVLGVAVLLFIAGVTLAPAVLVAGLWRTGLVRWWAVVPGLAWPVAALLAGTGPAVAAANLLALPLFITIARRLAAPADATPADASAPGRARAAGTTAAVTPTLR